MKKTYTNSNTKIVLVYIAVCLLASPLFATANSSSVYNEIITTSNSGGQNNSSGEASIEVSNTTIINGERSSYHYSTSTTGLIKHSVVIETDQSDKPTVTSEIIETEISAPATNNIDAPIPETDSEPMLPQAGTASTSTNQKPYFAWSQIESVLNYLYFYVEKLF